MKITRRGFVKSAVALPVVMSAGVASALAMGKPDISQSRFRMTVSDSSHGRSGIGFEARAGGQWRQSALYLDVPEHEEIPTRYIQAGL